MTAYECAILLNVSRRTIYRWLESGRLPWPIQLDAANPPTPRRRGPQRSPMSARYMSGRHTFRAWEEGR